MERADLKELNRVKRKLKCRPPQPLQEFEAQIILRHLEAAHDTHGTVGAPALLTGPHKFIAIDYWWLRENGKGRHAPKMVAARWGLSAKAVLKYASEHKEFALKYVREWQVKAKLNPELYRAALEPMLDLIAMGFRQLGE
jgi:hypothetical protein